MNLLDELKQKINLESIYHNASMNDETLMGRKTFLNFSEVILMDMAYEKILTDEDEIAELCDTQMNPILQDLHAFAEDGLGYKYCDQAIDNDSEMTYHSILITGWRMAFIEAYKLIASHVEKVNNEEKKND